MTSKNCVSILEENKPEWFITESSTESSLIGMAVLRSEIPNASTQIDLRIQSRNGKAVEAFEQKNGTLFPAFCPERHINSDGSFCIGLNYSTKPITAGNVNAWWQALLSFLQDQLLAERTGVWRIENSLPHGESAAHLQLEAEALAEKLCIKEEYWKAMVSETSWLKILIDRVCSGQLRLDDTTAQNLTYQAAKFGLADPGSKLNKKRAKKLVSKEQKRRKAENYYWQQARICKLACCGKMPACRLSPKG